MDDLAQKSRNCPAEMNLKFLCSYFWATLEKYVLFWCFFITLKMFEKFKNVKIKLELFTPNFPQTRGDYEYTSPSHFHSRP